jgi:tetratricopeptide (TPR) repeat protein
VNLGVEDYERAIAAFKEALKIRHSLGSYLWMGFCYQGKGENVEARRLYDLCINGAPELAGLIEDDEEKESIKQMAMLFASELAVVNITHLYLHTNGQQHGPYPIAKVKGWLDAGQVRETDLDWYEGAGNWVPLSSVPGIRI